MVKFTVFLVSWTWYNLLGIKEVRNEEKAYICPMSILFLTKKKKALFGKPYSFFCQHFLVGNYYAIPSKSTEALTKIDKHTQEREPPRLHGLAPTAYVSGREISTIITTIISMWELRWTNYTPIRSPLAQGSWALARPWSPTVFLSSLASLDLPSPLSHLCHINLYHPSVY